MVATQKKTPHGFFGLCLCHMTPPVVVATTFRPDAYKFFEKIVFAFRVENVKARQTEGKDTTRPIWRLFAVDLSWFCVAG